MRTILFVASLILGTILGCEQSWPPVVRNRAQIEALPPEQRDIRAVGIRDSDLALISTRFSKLDYLLISYSDITDKGISELSKCSDLYQIVIISGSLLSDASINVLCDLPALQEIIIENAHGITDRSLVRLSTKKNLKVLQLKGAVKLTTEAKKALLRELPQCQPVLE